MSYKLLLEKKNKRWLWTAVNHWQPGILAWVVGDSECQTFKPLWKLIQGWQSFLYVTYGWTVYPCFINDCDQKILKTYMTRVEGENTRLRHYLARLKRKTLCYSKSEEMLRLSIKLLLHYLHFDRIPL
jgi:insertion element IS1 protein InsB